MMLISLLSELRRRSWTRSLHARPICATRWTPLWRPLLPRPWGACDRQAGTGPGCRHRAVRALLHAHEASHVPRHAGSGWILFQVSSAFIFGTALFEEILTAPGLMWRNLLIAHCALRGGGGRVVYYTHMWACFVHIRPFNHHPFFIPIGNSVWLCLYLLSIPFGITYSILWDAAAKKSSLIYVLCFLF